MARPNLRAALLNRRLHAFSRLLDKVESGDVGAVHRARVASRRLRELLPVLQLEAGTSRRLGRRLRRVTSSLGRVRELDVLISRLDELQESGRFDRRAVAALTAVVADQRTTARRELAGELPMAELRRIATRLHRLAASLTDAPDAEPRACRWAIDARIARRATRLGEAMDRAGAVYLPDRLHQVRIALKKLRYAVELAAEAGDAARRAELPTFKRAQDLLGHLHDFQVLIERARQAQATADGGHAAADAGLDGVIRATEDECRRLHAEYVAMRPALRAACDRVAPHAARSSRRGRRRAAG